MEQQHNLYEKLSKLVEVPIQSAKLDSFISDDGMREGW